MARPVPRVQLFPVSLLFVLGSLAAAHPTFAQQTPDPASLPPPPAPKQEQADASQKQERGRFESTFDLLSRRSVFFPELAHNPGPLDGRRKLELAVDETVAPSRFVGTAFTAGMGQARDSLGGYGQEWGGYGKRFGSSVASNASDHFFGTFLLPSLLHQDPRYFVKFHGSTIQRVGYAVERVVVTRTDDGRPAFNWSRIMGALMAESLATSYLPSSEQTVAKTFDRFGVRIGFSAVSNIVREYWPTIFKSLRMEKMTPNRQPDPGTVSPPTTPPQPPSPPAHPPGT